MGTLEVSDPELTQVSIESEKENATMIPQGNGLIGSIVFGSFGTVDEPVVDTPLVETKVTDDQVKGTVEEWPTGPKNKVFYSFYFVKDHSDPRLRDDKEWAYKEIEKIKRARDEIYKELKAKQLELDQVFSEMKPIKERNGILRAILSLKEHSSRIKSLEYRIQHESIPLSEEKKILKEIKQLEEMREREKGIAKKEMLTRDEAIKEQDVVESKLKQLNDNYGSIAKEIRTIKAKLSDSKTELDKAYHISKLINKDFKEENASYYRNRTILDKARKLAWKKDIKSLKELGSSQVEDFMSVWNKDEAFRTDYLRRLHAFKDYKYNQWQFNKQNDQPMEIVQETNAEKKENGTVSASQNKISWADEVEKELESEILEEAKKNKTSSETNWENLESEKSKAVLVSKPAETEKISVSGEIDAVMESKPIETENILVETKTLEIEKISVSEEIDVFIETEKILVETKPVEVDEMKLKEMKKEEEVAKAKLAMERKKRAAEKKARRAALKAQKEAEDKLKKNEEKVKKKAAAKAPAPDPKVEPIEADEELVESKEVDEAIQDHALTSSKEKEIKEKLKRYRNWSKGSGLIVKAVFEEKIWIAFAFLVILVASYYYLF